MYNVSAFLTHLQVQEIPGIMIFRSSATLYFANAEMYIDALYEKVYTHKHNTHIYSQAYSFTHIYIKSNYKTLLTTGYYPKHSSNINIHCVISPNKLHEHVHGLGHSCSKNKCLCADWGRRG